MLGPDELDSVAVKVRDEDVSRLELTWDGPHRRYVDGRWGGKLDGTGRLSTGPYRFEVVVTTADGDRITKADQFAILPRPV
ncbi:MAG: hypothetical protein ABEJ92_08710 [Halobacteriales archaeon]